ncbi:TPA: CYTH domain-containing protein, partial [Streptococcus suis]|nr:CYTH domain-containing protein [Streptococcus suis]
YKILLDYEQYYKLIKMLPFSEKRIQKNYYYDTSDFYFSDRGFTIRIRSIDGLLPKLQIKQLLVSEQYGTKCNKEYEKIISTINNSIEVHTLTEMTGEKFNLECSKVINLGYLTTTRLICNIKNCEIALDKNEYLNKVDYELEIEFDKDNQSALKILEYLGIKTQDSTLGKNKRFVQELKRHQ